MRAFYSFMLPVFHEFSLHFHRSRKPCARVARTSRVLKNAGITW